MAAGLSLEEQNIDALREGLNERCGLTEEDLIPKLSIDAIYALSGLNEELLEELELLEPFGRSNEKPLLAEREIKICRMSLIGKARQMLKLVVEDAYGCRMDALYFGDAAEFEKDFRDKYGEEELRAAFQGKSENARVSVIYYPSIHEFNGVRSIEIVIGHYMFS